MKLYNPGCVSYIQNRENVKQTLAVITILILILSSYMTHAQTPAGTFKSVDEEVGLEVHRGNGDVKLTVQVKDIKQYHHIVVERSAESPNYFGKCKYISCATASLADGKLMESDRYPYAATKDVYYRIKTVTNDGIERAYPPVLLAAVSQ
jgi:hypothetical protein